MKPFLSFACIYSEERKGSSGKIEEGREGRQEGSNGE